MIRTWWYIPCVVTHRDRFSNRMLVSSLLDPRLEVYWTQTHLLSFQLEKRNTAKVPPPLWCLGVWHLFCALRLIWSGNTHPVIPERTLWNQSGIKHLILSPPKNSMQQSGLEHFHFFAAPGGSLTCTWIHLFVTFRYCKLCVFFSDWLAGGFCFDWSTA